MKLSKIVRIMYDLQVRCRKRYNCPGCAAYQNEGLGGRGKCKVRDKDMGVPANWNIEPEDIARLEVAGR